MYILPEGSLVTSYEVIELLTLRFGMRPNFPLRSMQGSKLTAMRPSTLDMKDYFAPRMQRNPGCRWRKFAAPYLHKSHQGNSLRHRPVAFISSRSQSSPSEPGLWHSTIMDKTHPKGHVQPVIQIETVDTPGQVFQLLM